MSALILRGAEVAQKIKDEVRAYTDENPGINLTIFQVGDNPASNTYIRNKVRVCADCGMDSSVDKYSDPQEYDRCIDIPDALRYCTGSGVMLQLPLPKGWDEDYFVNCINASQDADCLTHVSLGQFYASKSPEIAPCTARGIIDILKYYNIEIAGKHAVVVGRSNIVGKPVAHLLCCEDATVTVCHSRTPNLAEFTKQADILVVAIGKPKFITSDMIKPGAVVIDVGINRTEEGTFCGDVDFDQVKEVASAVTPVPGGVGPLTVANLLLNTIKLHNKAKGKKNGTK